MAGNAGVAVVSPAFTVDLCEVVHILLPAGGIMALSITRITPLLGSLSTVRALAALSA